MCQCDWCTRSHWNLEYVWWKGLQLGNREETQHEDVAAPSEPQRRTWGRWESRHTWRRTGWCWRSCRLCLAGRRSPAGSGSACSPCMGHAEAVWGREQSNRLLWIYYTSLFTDKLTSYLSWVLSTTSWIFTFRAGFVFNHSWKNSPHQWYILQTP